MLEISEEIVAFIQREVDETAQSAVDSSSRYVLPVKAGSATAPSVTSECVRWESGFRDGSGIGLPSRSSRVPHRHYFCQAECERSFSHDLPEHDGEIALIAESDF